MRGITILNFYFLILIFFLSFKSDAQVLVFASKKQSEPLTKSRLNFVAGTLNSSKSALHLKCSVTAKVIDEVRQFSSGFERVEMLEIEFTSRQPAAGTEKFYIPVGSKTITEQKISKFSGVVEEIQLEANDLTNSRFIFQHNGKGEIVWMTFEDDLKTTPCAL